MSKNIKNSAEFTVRNLRAHRRFCRVVGCAVSFFTMAMSSAPAFAATAVLGGSASLDQATGATLSQNTDTFAQFTSSSTSAVLDWSKFKIGSGQEMNFNGAGTTFFNLVNATAGKSQIDGMISGNGSVWVINPNGIAFGANSTVNVGGLFAAAAGNIENADALRNGTATMPSFSSFEGAVSSSSTSKFTANQVAMLGKTASVAGDFTGVSSLNIGAAGSMVVDEVSGGKISINVSAFADDPDSVGLELGDLNLGDVANGVNGGNLVAFSDRGISVKGDVTVGGNALVYNVENDIRVEKDASLVSTSENINEVNVYSAAYDYTGAHGDIVIDGTVSADAEFGLGSVNIVAGKGEGNSGNATVNGTVSADYYAQVSTRTGDVNVNGTVKSVVIVGMSTHDGDINVAEQGQVLATGEYSDYGLPANVSMYSAMDRAGKGDVRIDGTVRVGGDKGSVEVLAGFSGETQNASGGTGDVDVKGQIEADVAYLYAFGENGNISSAVHSSIDVQTLDVNTKDGNIAMAGKITAERLALFAGGIVNAANNANKISTLISAEGSAVQVHNSKSLDVGDIVSTGGNVDIATTDGDINVFGIVEAKGTENASVTLRSATAGYFADGGVSVLDGGKVKATGAVNLYAANGYMSMGDAVVNGMVEADTVFIASGLDCTYDDFVGKLMPSDVGGDGSVSVGGEVKAASKVMIGTANGNVVLDEGAIVKTVGENAELDIFSGYAMMTAGDITINGTVVSEKTGDIEISSGLGKYSEGNTIIGNKGRISSGGKLSFYSGFDSTIYHNDYYMDLFGLNGFGGEIKIDGKLQSQGDMLIHSVNGVLGKGELDAGSSALSVDGGLGGIKLTGALKASDAVFTGDSYNRDYGLLSAVEATSSANKFDSLSAFGSSVIISGHGDVQVEGIAAHRGDIKMYWDSGNISLPENSVVSAAADGSLVRIVTGMDGMSSGNIDVDGRVVSGGNIDIRANASGSIDITGNLNSDGETFLLAKGDIEVAGEVSSGGKLQMTAQSGGSIAVEGTVVSDVDVSIFSEDAGVKVGEGASVQAIGPDATVQINASANADANGDVVVDGSVSACHVRISAANGEGSSGNVAVGSKGEVTAGCDLRILGGVLAGAKNGEIVVSGSVKAGESAELMTGNGNIVVKDSGKVEVSGESGMLLMGTTFYAGQKGDIIVDGLVDASGEKSEAILIAGGKEQGTGSIYFGKDGKASADAAVYAEVHQGNLTQEGASVEPAKNGYGTPVTLRSAMSAETVNINIDGNVGSSSSGFVAVDGKVFGWVKGNANIAAAGDKPLVGGENPGSKIVPSSTGVIEIEFGNVEEGAKLVADGNLTVHTSSEINAYGNFLAGGDLTVSAAKFGDVSYLHAGGKLTVNNVGKPGSPQIAYFESVNGVEPRINNQPNDTVIFVDGRLAGGNTQIINTFGANEAFMVQTPELKSTQGIFGNPTFMHSDLDVANPLEVSAIDYMIQDIPRLTLSSDFPAEVDRNVEANGLSSRDSIWFGQEKANAKNDESEEKSPEDDKPENDKAQVANTLASIR